MEHYHKINSIFKRDIEKTKRLIIGDWATPELNYLHANQWEFTEKVDGTSIVISYYNEKVNFGGRTPRSNFPGPLLDYMTSHFKTKLFEKADLQEVTLFGEGYGSGIQSGGNYRKSQSFVLFDVKIGDFWLDRVNVDDIARKLGIDSVPTIGTGTLLEGVDIVRAGLQSIWGNFEAEGIVARPVVPMFSRKGDRILTKIKGVDFK